MSFLTEKGKPFPTRTCHTLLQIDLNRWLRSTTYLRNTSPLTPYPKSSFPRGCGGAHQPSLYIGRNAAPSGPVLFPSAHPKLLLHPLVIAGLFVWTRRSSFFLLCLLASAGNPDITWSSYNQSFLQPPANKSICPIPSVMTTLSTCSISFMLQT